MVPVYCPVCGGVAVYLDRAYHGDEPHDCSQLRRPDGSVPKSTDRTDCGSCGVYLAWMDRLIGMANGAAYDRLSKVRV
jgi:hypothetical protein